MADSDAFPGTSGALENTSYGVSGESGSPIAKPAASGGLVPGPFVPCEMNVVCASSDQRIVPGRGDGDGDGDGDSDDVGVGAVCALAGTAQIANVTSARTSAADVVGVRFTVLLMRRRSSLVRLRPSGRSSN
jgi:hypothetical protein